MVKIIRSGEETTIKEIAQINTGKKDTKDAITNGSYDFTLDLR